MTVNQASNPIYLDATTTVTGMKHVLEIDWIDDNGDVTHDSTLTLAINGVTIAMKVQPTANDLGMGAVIAKFGPWSRPIKMEAITATISQGAVLIWCA